MSTRMVPTKRRRWLAAALGMLLAVPLVIAAQAPASAVGPRPLFQAPFPCGETGWRANGRLVHGTDGNSYPADLNWGSGSADLGRTVVASAAGHALFTGDTWNTVKVDHGGGWFTYYRHMQNITIPKGVWTDVAQGAPLGQVSNFPSGDVHLHYEQVEDGRVVQIYFDGVALPSLAVLIAGKEIRTPRSLPPSNNCGGGGTSPLRFPVVASPGDLSGDGKGDVIAVDQSGDMYLYAGNGGGGFTADPPVKINSGWGVFSKILTPGDFDSDGVADLLAVTSAGNMYFYRGAAGGGIAQGRVDLGVGWQVYPHILTPGDFNGDGRGDVIGVTSGGDMYFYPGNGTGGFASGGSKINSGWQVFSTILAPGDFTRDGKADLLGVKPDGSMHLYAGNGTAGFRAGTGGLINTGWNVFGRILTPGRFDGDTYPDIIATEPGGNMWFYAGGTSNGFASRPRVLIGTGFN